VKLKRDDLPLAGWKPGERISDRRATERDLGSVLHRHRRGVLGLGHQRGDSPASPELVERGVAGDPEQPCALLAAATVKRAAAAIGPLERQRGDILCARAVTQHGAHVREHVVTTGPVERLEPIPWALGLTRSGERLGFDHTLTTAREANRHEVDIVREVRVALAITVLVLAITAGTSPAISRGRARNPTPAQIRSAVRAAERAPSLWATVNICATRRYPNTIGIRGQMPTLGFAAWLTMFVRINYYSVAEKRFLPVRGATKRVRLGRLSSGLQQDGATFGPFQPHAGLLDATVRFVWRRSGRLLGETTRGTSAGHHSADFGSPPRFSATQCRIR
jgi:hypothetical protein